jgi:hypothetical protein
MSLQPFDDRAPNLRAMLAQQIIEHDTQCKLPFVRNDRPHLSWTVQLDALVTAARRVLNLPCMCVIVLCACATFSSPRVEGNLTCGTRSRINKEGGQ